MGFGDEIPKQGMGRRPHNNPHREAIQKSKNQGAKRNLIPTNPLKTAAKRRWGLGMKSPSRAWGGGPIITPIAKRFKKARIKERSET